MYVHGRLVLDSIGLGRSHHMFKTDRKRASRVSSCGVRVGRSLVNSQKLYEEFEFEGAELFDPAEGKPRDVANVPVAPGVYAFVSESPFRRFLGESDILKIGSGGGQRGLRGRLNGYYNPGPTQATNLRIFLAMDRYPWAELGPIVVCWKVTPDGASAAKLEGQLLMTYEEEHGELPPWNHSGR